MSAHRAHRAFRGRPRSQKFRRSTLHLPGYGVLATWKVTTHTCHSWTTSGLERSRWRDGRPEHSGCLRDSVVTEKGDLCDNTHSANAGGTRPPQLRCNDDSSCCHFAGNCWRCPRRSTPQPSWLLMFGHQRVGNVLAAPRHSRSPGRTCIRHSKPTIHSGVALL